MIPVWIKKIIASDAVGNVRRIAMRLYDLRAVLVAGIGIYMLFVILKSGMELRDIRLNQKQVKVWNKKIETTAEDDSLIVDELRKLREHEVVIIYTNEDEKVRIKRIADDSLQFWADSLYNGTK
jgi:hypothetical protein